MYVMLHILKEMAINSKVLMIWQNLKKIVTTLKVMPVIPEIFEIQMVAISKQIDSNLEPNVEGF